MNHDICPHGTDITEHRCEQCSVSEHPPQSHWKFEPSDFIFTEDKVDGNMICKAANAKLAEWMKDARAVYADGPNGGWGEERYKHDTYRALVVDINPIEKECTKHEPSAISVGDPVCLYCDKKIEAVAWKVIE